MKFKGLNPIFCSTFYLLLLSAAAVAQSSASKVDTTETVILTDPRIETLADRYNRTYEQQGFRVLIISSSKKELAKKAKSRFVAMYEGYTAYEIYQQPYFIIKVGDFLTKLEAERVHRMIKDEFPEAYIVPDVIRPFEQYVD